MSYHLFRGKLQTVQSGLYSLKNNQNKIAKNILLKSQHHYLWLHSKDQPDACDNIQTNGSARKYFVLRYTHPTTSSLNWLYLMKGCASPSFFSSTRHANISKFLDKGWRVNGWFGKINWSSEGGITEDFLMNRFAT